MPSANRFGVSVSGCVNPIESGKFRCIDPLDLSAHLLNTGARPSAGRPLLLEVVFEHREPATLVELGEIGLGRPATANDRVLALQHFRFSCPGQCCYLFKRL